MRGYPKRFLLMLVATVAAVAVSGLLLVPALLEFRLEWDTPLHLASALRVPVTALHTLSGFVFAVIAGALWSVHMRAGWRQHRLRGSGGGFVAVLIGLVVSAAGLLYFGDPQLSVGSSVAHAVLGAGCVLLFGWHWVQGRRLRLRRHQQASEPPRPRLRLVRKQPDPPPPDGHWPQSGNSRRA